MTQIPQGFVTMRTYHHMPDTLILENILTIMRTHCDLSVLFVRENEAIHCLGILANISTGHWTAVCHLKFTTSCRRMRGLYLQYP